tara:strand:- start:3010 stop:3825 length:816 start_codon:yes stop_codon:yes gene_type:complete
VYYLKLNNVESIGNGRLLVTVGDSTMVVPEDAVTTQVEYPTQDIAPLLEHMRRLTSHIKGLGQPANLSLQVPSSTAQAPSEAPDREASHRQEPEPMSPEEFESLGLSNKTTNAPFQVNEEAQQVDLIDVATKLNKVYDEYPKRRRQVVQRIAGMVRLDMLRVKECLSPELRRAVLGSILSRDSLKTSVVPPDLAAFVDDRPLSETLGSRGWDPGSEQAKDNLSSNWMESQSVMDKIANEVDDSEFAHLYPSTSDVAVQVNRKFSSADESKR